MCAKERERNKCERNDKEIAAKAIKTRKKNLRINTENHMNIYENLFVLPCLALPRSESSFGWVIKNQLRHSVARACDHTLR